MNNGLLQKDAAEHMPAKQAPPIQVDDLRLLYHFISLEHEQLRTLLINSLAKHHSLPFELKKSSLEPSEVLEWFTLTLKILVAEIPANDLTWQQHLAGRFDLLLQHGLNHQQVLGILCLLQQCILTRLSDQGKTTARWLGIATATSELLHFASAMLMASAESFQAKDKPLIDDARMNNPRTAQLSDPILQVQIAQLHEQFRHMTYVITHDLNAPLRAIAGFSQLLRKGLGDQLRDDQPYYLQTIENKAEHMKHLIENIRLFSLVSQSPIQPTEFKPNELVNELIAMHARGNDIDIDNRLPEDLVVLGDKQKFKLAMGHLIDNAIKFSVNADTKRAEVSHEHEGDHHRFAVVDHGVGFNNQLKDKLFNLFQRLHPAKEFVGNGVGLALVDIVAKQHQGTVSAHSDQHATRFSFSVAKHPNAPP